MEVDKWFICHEVDSLLQDETYKFDEPIYIEMISVTIQMDRHNQKFTAFDEYGNKAEFTFSQD